MRKYFKELSGLLFKVESTNTKNETVLLSRAIREVVDLIICCGNKGNKVIFVGNGGSASIASHISTDLLKNSGIPAIAFSDVSLITCLSNDFGYKYVFEKTIEMLARRGDVLFAVSSSGRSENILRAVKQAKNRGCIVVTLSGFDRNNPLRKSGKFNFYLPSYSYGYVEIVHLAICHCIADRIREQ